MSLVRTWTRRSAGSGSDQASLAGPTLARWRRGLQIALGLIWLLDAALQYQPYMFTSAFARDVLAPAGEGSPAVIHGPVSWSASLVAAHPVIWNTLFATIQLLLAAGLLWRPTVRAALAASVAWALGVWWIGEGAGGLLAGGIPPIPTRPELPCPTCCWPC